MFKTILAFIKAHTIATTITATVIVSTAVATPIIINQAQEPKKEIETGQVQENIIDNTVIDDTVEENTETPEENITDENTTVPEEEQKVETSKEENKQDQSQNQGTTKPTTPTSSTPTTNNNKTETPTQPSSTPDKLVKFNFNGGLTYNETQKIIVMVSSVRFSKNEWLSSEYARNKKIYQEALASQIEVDARNGKPNKEYCRKKMVEYGEEVYRYQCALEYLKLHENDIQEISNANNEFLYEGRYYPNYTGTLEGCINVASKNRDDWKQNYETAPQYSSSEKDIRDQLSELERAYNYIKSH